MYMYYQQPYPKDMQTKQAAGQDQTITLHTHTHTSRASHTLLNYGMEEESTRIKGKTLGNFVLNTR